MGVKRAETDEGGYYRFANLPLGAYSVTVASPGFRTFRQEGIALEVGHLPSIEVRLEVGAISETVEVSSQAALIDARVQPGFHQQRPMRRRSRAPRH